MRDEVEYKGYWSSEDKKIWQQTNWKERDYCDLPVEGEEINLDAYFYSTTGVQKKKMTFIKYIRSNTIFPPYYGPKKPYSVDIQKFIEEGSYVSPCYDGRDDGNYAIHDRFESDDVYNTLSR